MRHVKLRPGTELNAEAVGNLIAAACADMRQGLGVNSAQGIGKLATNIRE